MYKHIVFSISLLLLILIGCSPDSNMPIEAALNSNDDNSFQTQSSLLEESIDVNFDWSVDLDGWVGKYEYIEGVPEEMNGVYLLNIHKSIRDLDRLGGVYYAEFSAWGRMLDLGTLAIIQGNEEEISVIFYAYLPGGKGSTWSDFKPGDVLFTLKKNDSSIVTEWVELMVPDQPNNAFTTVVMTD